MAFSLETELIGGVAAEPIQSAGFGPVTSTGEMVATSVGAGILLGGFVAAVVGIVRRRDVRDMESVVTNAGSFGGVMMAVAVTAEVIFR